MLTIPRCAGHGLSQADFMHKDTCITVDEGDNVLGSASKKDVHVFDSSTPQGRLHRAFSMFLFDSQNRLLLQQRAASKVTFPQVCICPAYSPAACNDDSAVNSPCTRLRLGAVCR